MYKRQCFNRANRPRSPSTRNDTVQRPNESDNRQSYPDQPKNRRNRNRQRKESTIDPEQFRGSIGSSPDLQFDIDIVSPDSNSQSTDQCSNQTSFDITTEQTVASVFSVSHTVLQAVKQSTKLHDNSD